MYKILSEILNFLFADSNHKEFMFNFYMAHLRFW